MVLRHYYTSSIENSLNQNHQYTSTTCLLGEHSIEPTFIGEQAFSCVGLHLGKDLKGGGVK